MVAGRDALSVRGRGSVVEVRSSAVRHLGPGTQAHLLLLLRPGGSHADHPDEEDQQDQEDDGPGDAWIGKSSMKNLGCIVATGLTSSNVSKLRLCLAVVTVVGAGTLAVRVAILVLETLALQGEIGRGYSD